MIIKYVLCLCLFAGLTATANADLMITADHDSYTHNADTNIFGAQTTFRTKWDNTGTHHMRLGFIQFDLSAYAGTDLSAASLALTSAPGGVGNGNTYRLWGLDPVSAGNNWMEGTITGANRPASITISGPNYEYVDETKTYGDTSLLTFTGGDAAAGNIAYSVGAGDANFLDFLNSAKEQNGGRITFILHQDGDSNDNAFWYSSEDAGGVGGSSRGPTLEVVAVPEPGTSLLLALAGMGATCVRTRRWQRS